MKQNSHHVFALPKNRIETRIIKKTFLKMKEYVGIHIKTKKAQ